MDIINRNDKKEVLLAFSALIWKYGDADENDAHVVSLSRKDFMDLGFQTLEVFHDESTATTYYRVKKSE